MSQPLSQVIAGQIPCLHRLSADLNEESLPWLASLESHAGLDALRLSA